jgi:enoyl-CoA hydratase/carnithine racemase
MKTFKNIILSKNNSGISRIILNDPKTYNSLSLVTINSLIAVFKILEKDNKTKVIIIGGAGKGFSSGHNLNEIQSLKN